MTGEPVDEPRRLRVGFIGAGRHSSKVLYPSLRYAPIDLEAVCDLDRDLAVRNQRLFGAKAHFTAADVMLEKSELDAVIAVAGPAQHPELAHAALSRGLPVLIEKPPALTHDKAEDLARESNEVDIPVTVGMMKRYAPVYRRVKSIIDSEDFGPISHVSATFRIGEKGGSSFALLLDAGIHILDLLRWLLGPYVLVESEKWRGEGGIALAILVRFDSGAVGTVHISDQGSWEFGNEWIEITGTRNVVRTSDLVELHHLRAGAGDSTWSPSFSIPQDSNNSLFLQGYAPLLRHWAQSLIEDTDPQPSIGELCHTMALIKEIEPDQRYEKRDIRPPHWSEEDSWLKLGRED